MSNIFKRHLTKVVSSIGAGACFAIVYGPWIGLGVYFALWVLMPFVPNYTCSACEIKRPE
jgi:hypothetical protein